MSGRPRSIKRAQLRRKLFKSLHLLRILVLRDSTPALIPNLRITLIHHLLAAQVRLQTIVPFLLAHQARDSEMPELQFRAVGLFDAPTFPCEVRKVARVDGNAAFVVLLFGVDGVPEAFVAERGAGFGVLVAPVVAHVFGEGVDGDGGGVVVGGDEDAEGGEGEEGEEEGREGGGMHCGGAELV